MITPKQMLPFFKSRTASFRNAFSGWWHVIRTQRNAWIHAIASAVVVTICVWLRISPHDWAVILLSIAMVWASEFFNTALEAITDLASPQDHPLAKVGKDVGAAAVLIAAMSALLIGIIILGPPLWDKISVYINSTYAR